jgi:glutathione S-transferase
VVSFQEFTDLKPSLPSGQLPVLEIEDGATGSKKVMDQSNAIMRYVGKLGGLYPSDPVEALEVDIVIETVEEAGKFLGYTMIGPKGIFFTEETLSDQEKIDIRKKLLDPSVPKNMANVSVIHREHVSSIH